MHIEKNKEVINLGNYLCEKSKNFDKMYKGEISARKDIVVTLTGILNGNVHISNNAIFNLSGILTGNLYIDNAEANIHGVLNGNIINKQGQVYVAGTINGKIISDTNINISPNAIIKN